MSATAEPPEMRIGDRERAATDARLRRAQDDGMLTLAEYDERARDCYGARYQRELDHLVADLPDQDADPASAPSSPPAPEPTVHADAPRVEEPDPSPARGGPWPDGRGRRPDRHPDRRHGKGLRRAIVPAIVAVVALVVGPGVLGADQGAAVFGGRTVTAERGSSVEVGVLFGGVTVVVPDGVPTTTSGTVVFGGIDCDDACRVPATAGPPVTVFGRGAFGGVHVVTASEAARGEQDRHGDDD